MVAGVGLGRLAAIGEGRCAARFVSGLRRFRVPERGKAARVSLG